MSFFQLSTGETVEQVNEFDSGGGDIELIPNNTALLACIADVKWVRPEGDPAYVNAKWSVILPDKYKGRVIFQKIRVNAPDPKKADKAKTMFVAIDTLCGGKLFKAGIEPTDETMMAAFSNKLMLINSMVWEIKTKKDLITGEEVELPKEEWASGNWVRAISSKDDAKAVIAAQQAERAAEEASSSSAASQPAARPAAAAQRPAPTRPAPTQQPRPGTAKATTQTPAPQAQDPVDPEPDFENTDDDIPF